MVQAFWHYKKSKYWRGSMYLQTVVEWCCRSHIWGPITKDFDAKMGDFQTVLHTTKSVYKIQNLRLDQKGCFGLFSSAKILFSEISSVSTCNSLHSKARQDSLKWKEIQGRAEVLVQTLLSCVLCLCKSRSPTEILPFDGVRPCLTVPSCSCTCHSLKGLGTAPPDSHSGRSEDHRMPAVHSFGLGVL